MLKFSSIGTYTYRYDIIYTTADKFTYGMMQREKSLDKC